MIDDEPLICEVLGATVRLLGGKVVADTTKAKDGIELYKQHKPDIVLLDFHMPDMNGIDLLKAIKEFDPIASVIILTADDNTFVAEGAINAGAKGFINKNLGPELMLNSLKEFISQVT